MLMVAWISGAVGVGFWVEGMMGATGALGVLADIGKAPVVEFGAVAVCVPRQDGDGSAGVERQDAALQASRVRHPARPVIDMGRSDRKAQKKRPGRQDGAVRL
ncbi:hypothetical protein MishRS11D_15470 [Methylomagnum ishizawai]|nr:hypothetical protein MishRS11D_15470 [Methylomagnum ishizawai]